MPIRETLLVNFWFHKPVSKESIDAQHPNTSTHAHTRMHAPLRILSVPELGSLGSNSCFHAGSRADGKITDEAQCKAAAAILGMTFAKGRLHEMGWKKNAWIDRAKLASLSSQEAAKMWLSMNLTAAPGGCFMAFIYG